MKGTGPFLQHTYKSACEALENSLGGVESRNVSLDTQVKFKVEALENSLGGVESKMGNRLVCIVG